MNEEVGFLIDVIFLQKFTSSIVFPFVAWFFEHGGKVLNLVLKWRHPYCDYLFHGTRHQNKTHSLSIARCFLLCRLENNREKNSFSQNGFSQSKQTFTVSAASSIVKIEDHVKLHLKMPTAFMSNIKMRGPAFDERKPHSFCLLSAVLKRAFLLRWAREKRRRNFLEKIKVFICYLRIH